MSGAVLRASGSKSGVERFLETTPWKPSAVFWKGKFRTPASRRRSEINGFNIVVSKASGLNLPRQVQESLQFLCKHQREFQRLRRLRLHGVLDFGVGKRDRVVVPFYRFPRTLIERLAKYGLELEVSYYNEPVTGS